MSQQAPAPLAVGDRVGPGEGTGTEPRARGRRWDRAAVADRLFLLPVGVVFVVLFLIPVIRSGWWSLTNYNGYTPDYDFVGLANYGRLFSDTAMVSGFVFTLLYTVATTLVVTCLAIPLAVVLNRKFIGRNFVRSAFFFPAIPSIAVLGLVWGFILSPLGSGVINRVIETFGGASVPWLSTPGLARFSVILVGVWSQVGWHAILYLAYLQAIPEELTEVAIIDGANGRQRFFHITLPMLAPAMTVSQLLLLTGGLKVYDLPVTLTGGGPGYSTFTLTQAIIQRGIAQSEFGQASALAVVFMLVIGLIVAAQLAVARRLERRIQ
ncbi:carbohydrate ABC transporter permease [Actinotalea sp. K2]|uniref:carbohydrate ABC transporter permease n=1 Tax=Actinotalea sp. K2 TaxID=2939438 RepID=UPI002017BF0B|nr:sugar ABC transporter permease [Actinotalea sp. K2]MCL3861713.1 sugar ABC transporter permease [Actinotalea sp. K2]